jgi:hypothetical protein
MTDAYFAASHIGSGKISDTASDLKSHTNGRVVPRIASASKHTLDPFQQRAVICVESMDLRHVYTLEAYSIARLGLSYQVKVGRDYTRDLRVPAGGLLHQEDDRLSIRGNLNRTGKARLRNDTSRNTFLELD